MLRDIVFKKLEDYEVDTEYSVVVKELKEGEKPSIVSDSMLRLCCLIKIELNMLVS